MKKLVLFLFLIIIQSFNSSAQWYNQNSQLTDLLGGIRFTSDSIGWVFGTDQLTTNSIYKSIDGGLKWSLNFSTDGPISSAFILDDDYCWFTDLDEGSSRLFFSSNGGIRWNAIYTNSYFFYDLHFFDENDGLAFGFYRIGGNPGIGAIFRTNDSGSSWRITESGEILYVRSFFLDSSNGWCAGTADIGMNSIKRTTDGGFSWFDIPSSNINNITKIEFFNDDIGFVIAESNLYSTTNAGLNWNIKISQIWDFTFVDQNNGWCVSGDKIYNTTNGGNSWNLQHIGNGKQIYSIFFKNLVEGWACGDSGLVLKTINGGLPVELISFISSTNRNNVTLQWQTATETNNQGFEVQRKQVLNPQSSVTNEDWINLSFVNGCGTTTEPQSYSFVDKNLEAGNYQYRLKQLDYDGTFEYSKTIEVEIGTPTKFSLEQNFPNPFNPVTTIKFSIPAVGTRLALSVQLKVYDVLGKEVATLVNEEKTAGSYEVDFNASDLASGIYYYELRSGEFVETKKMILLK